MRPSIAEIRQVTPFATVIKWNLVGINMSASSSLSSPDKDAMNIRCMSTTLPKLTDTPMEVNIRGHKIKQPGIYIYDGQITLVFLETVDNTISNFLRSWRELCWETETGKQANKADLEATIIIQRLNAQDEAIFQYELIGCYLSDFDLGTLDGETPTAFMPNLIISYDYFKDKNL